MKDIKRVKGEIAMAGRLLESISQDEIEYARNLSRRKFRTDIESDRITSYQNGEVAGEKRGIKQGIRQGIRQAKLDMAENMLKSNEPIDKIVMYSGLSIETIETLEKKMKKMKKTGTDLK